LNPRTPTRQGPKPCSFDLARKPPLETRSTPLVKGKILTVLVKLKNRGLADSTLRNYEYRLMRIAEAVNLDDPEQVSGFISHVKGSNCYRETFVKAYTHYAKFCGLTWEKPRYKTERRIPKIPTQEMVKEIIAQSSRKYATIFKLLSETGAMPKELHNVRQKDIDLDSGTIAIQGLKGHAQDVSN